MLTVNIHDAKTQLSRLVEQAAQGEAFIIVKAGTPMVKVIPLDPAATGTANRLGFMTGEFSVPEDFDQMGGDEIEGLFTGHVA
jgi:prevent-host-death family protein